MIAACILRLFELSDISGEISENRFDKAIFRQCFDHSKAL